MFWLNIFFLNFKTYSSSQVQTKTHFPKRAVQFMDSDRVSLVIDVQK